MQQLSNVEDIRTYKYMCMTTDIKKKAYNIYAFFYDVVQRCEVEVHFVLP